MFRVEEGKKKKGRGKKASTMSLYRRSLFSPSTRILHACETRLRENVTNSIHLEILQPRDVNLLHLTFEALSFKVDGTSLKKNGRKSFDPQEITI